MTRLADRIRRGVRRVNGADVIEALGPRDPTVDDAIALGVPLEVLASTKARRLLDAAARSHAAGAVAPVVFDPRDLDGAPVVVVDDIARWFLQLSPGQDFTDLLGVVAPPFERFFVEAQAQPHVTGVLHFPAWGILFEVLRAPDGSGVGMLDKWWSNATGAPQPIVWDGAWVIRATLVVETSARHPAGPLVEWLMSIDADGTLLTGAHDEHAGLAVGTFFHEDDMDSPAKRDLLDLAGWFLFAALFAVALMHCKNVRHQLVTPPPKLSAKQRKRTGAHLVTYRVLDFGPIRRALEDDGAARTSGLPHALHICRGHFKTFADDSPLFGRHTGTYWWAPQVRGRKDAGEIVKTYRARPLAGTGRLWQPLDEYPVLLSHPDTLAGDPDLAGRGLAAHACLLNAMADALTTQQLTPLRPRPDEPQFDIAWYDGARLYVCEAKSLTAANEERQLRVALGQVARYHHLLDTAPDRAYDAISAVIAVEHAPGDLTWVDTCRRQGVTLLWPGHPRWPSCRDAFAP